MVMKVLKTLSGDLEKFIKQLSVNNKLTAHAKSAISNAAGVTLTAAQVVGGMIFRSGAVTVSDTFPTAALLLAACPGWETGDVRILTIRNANTGTLTLLTAAGVTLTGTMTIPTVNRGQFAVEKTAATTVTITALGVGAY